MYEHISIPLTPPRGQICASCGIALSRLISGKGRRRIKIVGDNAPFESVVVWVCDDLGACAERVPCPDDVEALRRELDAKEGVIAMQVEALRELRERG